VRLHVFRNLCIKPRIRLVAFLHICTQRIFFALPLIPLINWVIPLTFTRVFVLNSNPIKQRKEEKTSGMKTPPYATYQYHSSRRPNCHGRHVIYSSCPDHQITSRKHLYLRTRLPSRDHRRAATGPSS